MYSSRIHIIRGLFYFFHIIIGLFSHVIFFSHHHRALFFPPLKEPYDVKTQLRRNQCKEFIQLYSHHQGTLLFSLHYHRALFSPPLKEPYDVKTHLRRSQWKESIFLYLQHQKPLLFFPHSNKALAPPLSPPPIGQFFPIKEPYDEGKTHVRRSLLNKSLMQRLFPFWKVSFSSSVFCPHCSGKSLSTNSLYVSTSSLTYCGFGIIIGPFCFFCTIMGLFCFPPPKDEENTSSQGPFAFPQGSFPPQQLKEPYDDMKYKREETTHNNRPLLFFPHYHSALLFPPTKR